MKCGLYEIHKNNKATATHGRKPSQKKCSETEPRRCWTGEDQDLDLYRSTQPGHPFMGRHNEYQPKGGGALRLGSKDRYRSCVGGR